MLVNKAISSGLAAVHATIVNASDETPFIDNIPASGIDVGLIASWRTWLTQLSVNRAVTYLCIYGADQLPYDTGDTVGSGEQALLAALANELRDIENVAWIIAENWSDTYSEARIRAIAAALRVFDDIRPIGIHGDKPIADPNIDVWLMPVPSCRGADLIEVTSQAVSIANGEYVVHAIQRGQISSADVTVTYPSDSLVVQTDFLSAGFLTHMYPSFDVTTRANCLAALNARGYKHIFIYAVNEGDYGGPAFDYYTQTSAYRGFLTEIRNAGIQPIVWLNPDDAPTNAARSESALNARMDAFIPAVDDLVSSYVLGLELDEYWTYAKVHTLGTHLNTLTTKPIGVHERPNKWDYAIGQTAAWVDIMYLQYGFGLTVSDITTITQNAVAALGGRPVIAAEYNDINSPESQGKTLGDAAIAAGAIGFGNGGTPF